MAKRKKKSSYKSTPTKTKKAAPKKAAGKKLGLPSKIYAQVSPHSLGGVSLFEAGDYILSDNIANFTSEESTLMASADRLRQAGFEVLQITESTINIAGSPKTFEKAFKAPIEVHQHDVIKEFGKADKAEFLDCPNCDLPGLISTKGTDFEDLIEGIALEEPRYFMAANPFPPITDYWHHDVPAGISLACNADRAHRAGITGKGITVAMVDSGWFRHPFFTARGYRSSTAVLAPGASNANSDESGHGTGESANIFSLAPDVHLRPVKMSFVNTIAAFNAAVGLNPDIITCSWGSSIKNGPLSAANIALANAIAAAVASGITVIFSAGNGHWGFPGQHPDVISAGGVFQDSNNNLRASDYASGFASTIYAGRNVPDLSGIVGMRPRAMNIMLPVEPNDSIDRNSAGGSHPNGDETATNDGWAAFSGTSAAAPQLAGAAALIKQACSKLTPVQIRDILKTTARDVTTGRCHPNQNNPATPGPDLATGHGLVDAHRATMLARLRCIPIRPIRTIQPVRPIRPIQPIQPIQPVQPVAPIQPIQPVQPVQPISPVRPIQPVQPVQPVRPVSPVRPIQPVQPVRPIGPVRPVQPVQPIRPIQPINPIRPIGPVVRTNEGEYDPNYEAAMAEQQGQEMGMTEEEFDVLEDMVKKGQVDPGEI